MHDDDRDLDWTFDPEGAGAEDPGTRDVFEALKRAGREAQPPAGFVNKLSNELQEVHRMQNESLWYQFKRWLPAMAGAGVVMVAVVAAILIIPQYLRSTTPVEPSTDADTSEIVENDRTEAIAGAETVTDANNSADEAEVVEESRVQAGGGNAATSGLAVMPPAADSSFYPYPGGFAERPTYELATPLDGQAGIVAGYRLALADLPTDIDGALAWANQFGFQNPQAYTPLEQYGGGSVIVIGDNSERLNFYFGEGYGELFYENRAATQNSSGPGITVEDAQARAREWWRARGLNPDNYVFEVDPYSYGFIDPSGQLFLRVFPLVDGTKMDGWATGGDITFNGQGDVMSVRLPQYVVEPAGSVNVISQQEAFDAVVNGGRSISYFYAPEAGEVTIPEPPRSYTPGPNQYEVGQVVELQGWPNILQNAVTDDYYVEFYDYRGSSNLLLTGDMVAAFVEEWSERDITLSGVVVAVDNDIATVEVTGWDTTLSDNYEYIECFMGTATIDGAFTSDNGVALQLATVPEAFDPEGNVEICGEVDDNDVISWVHISVFADESFPPNPEEPFYGPVFHTEYGYDQEGVYAEFAEEEIVAEDWFGPDFPYQMGDTVLFGGQLFGSIYENSEGILRYELYLNGTIDDTATGMHWGFRLYGDEALLAQLAEVHGSYVRVEGTLTSPTDVPGAFEPGLEVTNFEPLGEITVQPYFGQVEFRELGGKTTMVFVDEATGAEFALDPSFEAEPEYYPEYNNENFSRIWMALSIHPYWEYEGLPVAQMMDVRFGREVDNMTDPADLLQDYFWELEVQPDYLEFEGENYFPFTGNFTIDQVELGYTSEPGFANPYFGEVIGPDTQPVTPVWIFHGTDLDTGATIVIQVDATPSDG